MDIGRDIEIAGAMSDAVEGGAAIAWRLLATLEGGSLLLAASALLAYSARNRAVRTSRKQLPCTNVAITNTSNEIGKEIKRRLEAQGCIVNTVTGNATSGADTEKYDALVVVGAQPKAVGLDGIAGLVSEDVYNNMQLLESMSARVIHGGCIAWTSAGADQPLGAFEKTADAYDAVLQASLAHIAKVFDCVPIWVGRCDSPERAAERVVAALMTCDTEEDTTRFSVRNAAHTIGGYLYRWLKIIT